MRTRHVVVTALGLAALLVAGGLMASNMGFKLNYQLKGPGSSKTGTNSLALPYNQQTNLLDAKNLIDDINASAGTTAVVSVTRFLSATDGTETYDGTVGTPFPLAPGEGYRVVVNQDVNYIIVGSHAPTLGIALKGPGSSKTGTNDFAYPYHATAADAKDLIDDINADAGSLAVVSVTRFLSATDGTETYDGTVGTPFPMVPGESYRVVVNTDVTYIPSHY